MSVVATKENTLSVSTTDGQPISLTIDADAPAAVQLVVESSCSCGGAARRTGAYTDTDFGTTR